MKHRSAILFAAASIISASTSFSASASDLCAEFSFFPTGKINLPIFSLSGYTFNNLGMNWEIWSHNNSEISLKIESAGVRITLPAETDYLKLTLQTGANEAEIEYFDKNDVRINGQVKKTGPNPESVEIVEKDISYITVKNTNNEVSIMSLCGKFTIKPD